jgi:membrane protease YdiL (CAAX protease family)
MLFHWKPIADVVTRHRDIAESIYWTVKLFLIVSLVWILGKRYRDALWLHPAKVNVAHVLCAALVATPLAAYYLKKCFGMALLAARFSHVAPATLKPELEKVFTAVWTPLTNQPSALAIVLSSIGLFASIPLGTVCLQGFVLNRLRRRMGATCSIVVVAALFTATIFHVFSRVDQLVLVFLMGITFGAIRIWTGSLGLTIGASVGINFLLYLPKWMIAVFYYSVIHRLSG